MKICSLCKQEKPFSEFHKARKGTYRTRCKVCYKQSYGEQTKISSAKYHLLNRGPYKTKHRVKNNPELYIKHSPVYYDNIEYLQQEIAKLEIWLLEQNIKFSKESFKAEDGKIHRLYITTNKINQKFYVGLHSHKRLDVSYIGCGISCDVDFENPTIYTQRALKRSPLWRAVKKYSKGAFTRIDFLYFYNREDLIRVEKQFIAKEMVFREDCYNGMVGGSLPPYNIGEANGNYGNRWTDEQKQKARDRLLAANLIKFGEGYVKGIYKKFDQENWVANGNITNKPCLAIDCSSANIIEFDCGKDMALFLQANRSSIVSWFTSNERLSMGLRRRKYVCFLKKNYQEFKHSQIKEIIINILTQAKISKDIKQQYIDVINQKY